MLVLDQMSNLPKFAPKTFNSLYLGPSINSSGHRLYNIKTRRILISRNAFFFDQNFLKKPETSDRTLSENVASSPTVRFEVSEDPCPNPPCFPVPPEGLFLTEPNRLDGDDETKPVSTHELSLQEENVSISGRTEPSLVPKNHDSQALVESENEGRIGLEESAKNDQKEIGQGQVQKADARTENVRAENAQDQVAQQPQPRRSSWIPKPSLKIRENLGQALIAKIEEPKSFSEAVNGKEAEQWKEAMAQEIKALNKNKTWTITELPPGRKAIGTKWVYKAKYNGDGSFQKFKARLVAKGFAQKKGIDYQETFAPVAKMTSLRVILAITAHENLEIEQIDVDSVFLNGIIDAEVFMRQLEGFEAENKNLVCCLEKGLYGLKQASCIWNEAVQQTLLDMGLKQLGADPCVYFVESENFQLIVGIHVDDFIIAGRQNSIDRFKNIFSKAIKQLGKAKFLVGLQVRKWNGEISILQSTYVKELTEDPKLGI